MCDNDNYSCLVAFLLAILFGFLIGLLVFIGLLTDVTIGLIIAIISAFIISIALFVTIIIPRYNKCIRKHSCGILIGIIGTILFATIALSIDIGTNIISAILVGLVAVFLTYLLIKFLKILNCIIEINECDNESTSSILNNNISLDNSISTSDISNNFNSEIDTTSNNVNTESNRRTTYCSSYNRRGF